MSEDARGKLRIYLGNAAGVGKTFAMLGEGHRRAERGTDVVVGFVETHGRKHTADLIGGLEVVPRTRIAYRGATFEEMDLGAVLARKPQVALVDELAHTNVPGSGNTKRWQDVEDLLDAGIDVISTVNIQHLESLNDVVEKITGVPQRETLPDAIVRAADQVELVDMTPEALRRRMAHGNIYPPEKIDAALTNYFRTGNLTALRELALLWLADKVDEGLQRYRTEHHIQDTWEARERVVVALTGGPEGDTLIRRAARIAARSSGGDLLAVHVTRSDGLTGADPAALAGQRRLAESLGGSYHQVVGDNIPEALLTFARAENATQLVLGASRRSWLTAMLTGPGIGARTLRGSGDIDVHIVTHAHMGRGRGLPSSRGGLPLRRRLMGYLLAVALAPLLTLALVALRGQLNLTSDVLIFLVAVIVVALVGGFLPALLAAVAGSLLLNYYFTPPIHKFTIAEANNVLALGVFVVVALLVSSVVDLAAKRTRQAARASAESQLLATTAGSVLRGERAVTAVLERVREAFGMDSVTLLERHAGPDGRTPPAPVSEWRAVAHSGAGPRHARRSRCRGADHRDADAGPARPAVPATDRRVLGAFAAYAAVALDAAAPRRPGRGGPPASPRPTGCARRCSRRSATTCAPRWPRRRRPSPACAHRTSLWADEDRDELLATADESLDRLAHLVDNLLDMSRLQAGALSIFPPPGRPGGDRGAGARRPGPGQPADRGGRSPDVAARGAGRPRDPGAGHRQPDRQRAPLLPRRRAAAADRERARRPGRTAGGRPRTRHPRAGPGRVFLPFQRLGDTDNTTGVGLGLALSRGLTEAMGGTLSPRRPRAAG